MANYKIIGADQKEYGPISEERVRQWISEGRSNAQSQAQAEGTTGWQPLSAFPEFAGALSAGAGRPPAGTVPPPMLATPPHAKTSGLAVTSLVMGILGFFTCGLSGLPGVIFGILGLNRIHKSRGQLGGKVMAVVGLCLSGATLLLLPILAGLLLPALARARSQARTFRDARNIQCVNNLKQLGLAVRLYSNDNKDKFPIAAKWCDTIQPDVGGQTSVFQCPSDRGAQCTYAFNARLSGMEEGKISPNTVMIFESQGGWNLSGGPELMIKQPRHGNTFSVCLADGSVQQVTPERLSQLVWDP